MQSYTGDLKIFLTEDGAEFKIQNGHFLSDPGLENFVLISLFTKKGFWGNEIINTGAARYGSEFWEKISSGASINLSNLQIWERAAEKDLVNPSFRSVKVDLTNPKADEIQLRIEIILNDGAKSEFQISGNNWVNR